MLSDESAGGALRSMRGPVGAARERPPEIPALDTYHSGDEYRVNFRASEMTEVGIGFSNG